MVETQTQFSSPQNAGVRVAVAGAGKLLGGSRFSGHARSSVRRLNETGFQAINVVDGDPRGLDVDLLVLLGNCRAFHRYRRLLRSRPDRRPRVAIWQIDPLPPVEFDPQLETRALALSAVLGRSRLLRPVELAANRSLCVAVASHGFGPYSDGAGVDSTMARAAVEAYSFIHHGFREGWLDDVFVSTIGKQEFLASRGIESTFAPVGIRDVPGMDRDQPRDIDVLFIGRLNKRSRRRRLAALRQEIEERGARMVVVERDCYGEKRTALLNRTKIVLHVHKNPWDTPWMRWVMAAECGCLVVSEPLSVPRPFAPGVHYVEAPLDDLPATIERLLESPADVLAMARGCADFIRKNLRADDSVEKIGASALKPQAAP